MSRSGAESENGFEVVTFPPTEDGANGGDLIPLRRVERRGAALEWRPSRTPPLSARAFRRHLDAEERLVCEHSFRRDVFRGGVEASVRPDIWCFLFDVFPCHSTARERDALLLERQCRYEALKCRWQSTLRRNFPSFDLTLPDQCVYLEDVSTAGGESSSKRGAKPLPPLKPHSLQTRHSDGDQLSLVFSEAKIYASRVPCPLPLLVESLRFVSKDVPRTDRDHAYFAGEAAHGNLLALRDALLTFAILHPNIGYVQGMNDLMARFLLVFESECIAFWAFNYYIATVQCDFLAEGMLQRIGTLGSLISTLDSDLSHYLHVCGASDMIFCHKWLLLTFQREFGIADGLRLLEILCSHHLEVHSLQGQLRLQSCRDDLQQQGIHMAMETMSDDFSFDLFVAAAILTLNRDRIFLCADGSQVHQYISGLSGNLDLDQILVEAERLFNLYCHKSLLDAFVLM